MPRATRSAPFVSFPSLAAAAWGVEPSLAPPREAPCEAPRRVLGSCSARAPLALCLDPSVRVRFLLEPTAMECGIPGEFPHWR